MQLIEEVSGKSEYISLQKWDNPHFTYIILLRIFKIPWILRDNLF